MLNSMFAFSVFQPLSGTIFMHQHKSGDLVTRHSNGTTALNSLSLIKIVLDLQYLILLSH